MMILTLSMSFLPAAFLLYQFSGLGITAGCHRLWSHKAYSARLPLRILLGFMQTLAFQVSVFFFDRLDMILQQ